MDSDPEFIREWLATTLGQWRYPDASVLDYAAADEGLEAVADALTAKYGVTNRAASWLKGKVEL